MTQPSQPDTLQGRRILIAEDDALLAMSLSELVASRGGLVVGPVPSVQAAIAAVRNTAPDAALLNVYLKDGASDELIDALRGRGVPMLLVTGAEATRPKIAGIPAVEKPFMDEEVEQALLRLLGPPDRSASAAS